jgi:two-component system, OmpR family, response regulator
VAGPTIAIAEDDPELRRTLARGLEEEGFAVTAVATGAELLSGAQETKPDAMIIDIGLPDADGRDVCQALRTRGIQAPVLFLTARDALVDRLAGFDAGGDDYVTKPFAFAELVARIHALLRRAGAEPAEQGDAGAFQLDPLNRTTSGDDPVSLTPIEYRLLARLISTPKETVRRRELIRAGWAHGARVSENSLDAYIARLRRKLRATPEAPAITTVHGIGYRID